MSLKLCDIDELKDYVKGMEESQKYDSLLNAIVSGISRRLEKFCDREFTYEADGITEYSDGDGERNFIIVRRPPIESVTSLHDDVDRAYGSDCLIGSTDYVWYESGRIELDGLKFLKGLKNIKVVYKGGYQEDTIPDDLKLACMMQSAFVFKNRDNLGLTGISASGGSMSIYMPMKLLPEVKAIIQPYVIWRM